MTKYYESVSTQKTLALLGGNMGVNIHIYQSPFVHESRMLKIIASLADRGLFDRIHVLAGWEPGLPSHEAIGPGREVTRLAAWGRRVRGKFGKLLAIVEWYLRVLWCVRRWKVACINCHSLVVMPLCVLLKYVKGCKLIYDTHELETETTSTGRVRKWISKQLERLLLPHADAVIVVGERIRQWYQAEYQRSDVEVVRNLPQAVKRTAPERNLLRDRLSIPEGERIFLYQGVIDAGRGVDLLIQAFSELPAQDHLVILGYGPLVDQVQSVARVNSNVHFHPAVPPHELPAYTAGADVGLAVIENVSLSYYYCLPNKIFEYLQSGVPAIVSNFPEMAAFVDEERCGWKVDVTIDAIRQLIAGLSAEEVASTRKTCLAVRDRYTWASEEQRLFSIYDRLSLPSTTDATDRAARGLGV